VLLDEGLLVADEDEERTLLLDLHLLIALSCVMISTDPFDEPQNIVL